MELLRKCNLIFATAVFLRSQKLICQWLLCILPTFAVRFCNSKAIYLTFITLCYFVLVFFSIAITSLGEEIANLSAFRTFFRFVLVWFCRLRLSRRV